MRRLRLTAKAKAAGRTKSEIQWAVRVGRWTPIILGVVGEGAADPSALDVGRATALVTNGVAHGLLAAELLGFDNVRAEQPEVWVKRSARSERPGVSRKTSMPTDVIVVHQVQCTTPAATLLELTDRLDDDRWEQAMELCGRKGLVTREQLGEWANVSARVRRVIKARGGLDIPFTESLLEILAIQLIRAAGLPMPVRQYKVRDPRTGRVVARCDLAWPKLGIFVELDGQQHKHQPVYDARRQTLITTIMRWQCGRLTWHDVASQPDWGTNQLTELLAPEGCLVP